MKKFILLAIVLLLALPTIAQTIVIGAGTGDTSAVLASQFSGANEGAKIQAAINAQATNGGRVIADFTGTGKVISPQIIVKPGVLVDFLAANYTVGVASKSIVAGTGAARVANVVTITTTADHGFTTGQWVYISGVTNTTFNGYFVIASTPLTTTFTYAQTAGDATSGSGRAGLPPIVAYDNTDIRGLGADGTLSTIFTKANNIDAPAILAVSSLGITDWWHNGTLEEFRVEGNSANQTVGDGIRIFQEGETSRILGIVSRDNKEWGFHWSGSQSGTSITDRSYAVNNLTGGFFFDAVSSTHLMGTVGGDNNTGPLLKLNAITGGGGFLLHVGKIKAEDTTAGGKHEPAIEIDAGTAATSVVLSIDSLKVSASAAHTNVIQVTIGGGASTPHIRVASGIVTNYTNMLNDFWSGISVARTQVAPDGRLLNWRWTVYSEVLTGSTAYTSYSKALSNGANNNVGLGAFGMNVYGNIRITGPTAAFSVSGWEAFNGGTGNVDGRMLWVYNSTAQPMTITNEGAASTAANRIKTLSGADVVLPASTAFASFIYSGAESRWLLLSTNPSPIISATASLDFTALAANSCEVLTITVTGAADGDTVSLGIPNALADVDGATERTTFFGWVSAADVVSVRRCNVTGTVTAEPAAATVRAKVMKF